MWSQSLPPRLECRFIHPLQGTGWEKQGQKIGAAADENLS